jgi:peptide/nickel transport system permease protein
MILAIFLVYIPTYYRVVRGQVLQMREEEFVAAAHSLGASHLRILIRHIAPNTITSVLAIIPFNIADAILTEAGLS